LPCTERTVEAHVNAIFSKLELTESPEPHRRVLAVLTAIRATTPSARADTSGT